MNLVSAIVAVLDRLEGWVRDFISRIPEEEFDGDVWIDLTTGTATLSPNPGFTDEGRRGAVLVGVA